jgi:NAD-dependent deacetylase
MARKKLVVLTGAGISAESGIPTFRDANGLWEGHDIMEVASPEGWHKDPDLVLDFYNQRRKNALTVKPNQGHVALAGLEEYFDVSVITQNIDELHEQAGSTQVIHLHGKLFEAKSSADDDLIYRINGWELKKGQTCEKGSQLRPNVVWFGEPVPMMEKAIEEAMQAEIFMVVGTSLVVYPAAGLLHYVPRQIPVYVVDPNLPALPHRPNLHLIQEKASVALPELVKKLRLLC